MPFPPAFTTAWDNTFPPDTQAANQLGLDLRTFRTDVQQRMSLLSGILANRPTNMDATFGGAGYGILFFATDTNQIFQWNGAAWVEVTASFNPGGRLSTLAPVVTNGAGQDGLVLTIPAGSLFVGSVIRVALAVTVSAGDTVGVFFGATQISTYIAAIISGVNSMMDFIVTAVAAEIGFENAIITTAPGGITAYAPLSNNFTPAEAINAPIIIKTRQTVGAVPMVHNMLSVTWR